MFVAVASDPIWIIPDTSHLIRVTTRLAVAALVGGVVGFEREAEHKFAGLRTHMLVSLGAALFTLVGMEAGVLPNELSRIIQGVATGIGFLGAGIIVHVDHDQRVRGMTSAAGIWLTAALGMAVGVGYLVPALVGVVLGWIILSTLHFVERWLESSTNKKP